MLEQLTDWLKNTQANAFLSDTTSMWTWLIIPVSQSIHILSVAILMFAVAALNLRLLGLAGKRQTVAQLTASLMPWVWGALITLLATGTLQTIAEPGRELLNVSFRIKMVLLLITVAIAAYLQHAVKTDPNFWERSAERRKAAHMLASFSMVLWFGIVAAGRLIAYLG